MFKKFRLPSKSGDFLVLDHLIDYCILYIIIIIKFVTILIFSESYIFMLHGQIHN